MDLGNKKIRYDIGIAFYNIIYKANRGDDLCLSSYLIYKRQIDV